MAHDWNTPFTPSMSVTMPNGGTVTMQGPPAHDFNEGLIHLRQTHALYVQWGGWGGGRGLEPRDEEPEDSAPDPE